MKKNNICPKILLEGEEKIKVRFNETDALGIVWHGNYLVYFEQGRESLAQKHQLGYLEILKKGFTLPVIESSCKHLLPAKYGQTLTIKTYLIESNTPKLIYQYEIYNEKKQKICTGQTIQVFLDKNNDLCLYDPIFFKEWKEKIK